VRHGPLTALTMPKVALMPESSERPSASARLPGAGSSVAATAGAPGASTFNTAISVPGSLPASVAAALLPSGRVTVISSSRRTVCSR